MAKAKTVTVGTTDVTTDEVGAQSVNVTVNMADEKSKVFSEKFIGRAIDPLTDYPMRNFFSIRKNFMLFGDNEDTIIQFIGTMFTTNMANIAESIVNCGLFGVEVFEDQFPPHIMDVMAENQRYLTKDKDEYQG